MNKIFKTKYDVTTGQTKVVSELANNRQVASRVEGAESQPKCGVFFGGMLGAFKVLPLALVMAGILGVNNVAYGEYKIIKIDEDSGQVGIDTLEKNENVVLAKDSALSSQRFLETKQTVIIGAGDVQAKHTKENGWTFGVEKGVVIGYAAKARANESIAIGAEAVAGDDDNAKGSIAVGKSAKAMGSDSVVVGKSAESVSKGTSIGASSKVIGEQGTAVGNNVYAAGQGTALGSDVMAAGYGSIAIGNDDIVKNGYTDKLPQDTILLIYGYKADHDYGSDSKTYKDVLEENEFTKRYIKNGSYDNRKFSPTYAAGVGSIALGSRTVAFGQTSLAVGALSFALADDSTALGVRAFVDAEAKGGVAIGDESRVFAENSFAIGNRAESTSQGSLSFGSNAKAVGVGSIAIGPSVASNAKLAGTGDEDFARYIMEKTKTANPTITPNGSSANVTYGSENDSQLKFGNKSEVVNQGFSGKNFKNNGERKDNPITAMINEVIKLKEDIANKADKDRGPSAIKYEYKKDLKIETTEPIYETQQEGEHAISLGYHLSNNGDNTITIGSASVVRGANSVVLGALNNIGKYATNTIALGIGTNVFKENSVAIGTGVNVAGAGVVAIGSGVGVTQDNTIAVGYGAYGLSAESIVLGNAAGLEENAKKSIVIGNGAKVINKKAEEAIATAGQPTTRTTPAQINDQMSAISIGTSSYVHSEKGMAFGDAAKVENNAENAIAFGTSSKATNVSSIALGNEAHSTMLNSVALGYKSRTDYAHLDTAPYSPKGALTIPTSSNVGLISVGAQNYTRRIINVAAGSQDTDAVNVSQLKGLEEKVELLSGSIGDNSTPYFGVEQTNNSSEAKTISDGINKQKNYDRYVYLAGEYASLLNRQKNGGEVFNEESLQEIQKEIDKIGTPEIKGTASEITRLLDELKRARKNKNSGKLTQKSNQIERAITTDKVKKVNAISEEVVKKSNYKGNYAEGVDSIAIGYGAHTTSTAKHAVALGYKADAQKADSIALGSNSVADRAGDITGFDTVTGAAKTTADYGAWKSKYAALSIGKVSGNDKITRQITGVAAGSEDTDAVNLAQLKEATLHFVSVNGGSSTDGNYANNGAIGKNSIAIGVGAQSKSENSIVLGNNSKIETDISKSISIGVNNHIRAKKGNAKEDLTNTVALGSDNIITGRKVVNLGSGNKIGNTEENYQSDKHAGAVSIRLIGDDNITKGVFNTVIGEGNTLNESNWAQVMGDYNAVTKSDYAIVISSNKANKREPKTTETVTDSNYAIVIGNNAKATSAQKSVVIGQGAVVNKINSVAIGSGSKTTGDIDSNGYDPSTSKASTSSDYIWKPTAGEFAVGDTTYTVEEGKGKNKRTVKKPQTRRITGVAAGIEDTDVVNVAQLKAVLSAALAAKPNNNGGANPQTQAEVEAAKQGAVEAKNEAVTAKDEAEAAKQGAETAKNQAESFATQAQAAQAAAQTAQQGADAAKQGAETAKNQAETAKDAAQNSATKAEQAKAQADAAKLGAEQAQTAAQGSATQAENAKNAAQNSATQAETAKNAAVAAQTAAQTAQQGADAAKQGAETAKNQAETAKDAAQNSATKAEQAKNAAVAAQTAAQTAQQGADAAKNQAETARDGAVDAQGKAEAARNEAVNAKNEAETARNEANTAKDAAQNSASQAEAAKTKALEAQAGANAAKDEAVAARDKAQGSAIQAENAKQGAESARNEAVTAKEQAVLAQAGADAAKLGAEQAKDKAEKAQTSAEDAKNKANQAKDEAVAAKEQAVLAQTGAVEAKNQADAAKQGAEDAKRGAESAKNDAVAAQKEAEKAQAGAVEAQTGAEQAKTQAEEFAKKAEDAQTATESAKTQADAAKDAAVAAQGKAENFATKAEEAKQGALDAKNQAVTAQAGAEAAKAEALTAKQGAETAQQGALAAQSKAEAAQNKAEEFATQAESAKTAALDAKGKADAAKQEAVDAKTKAEQAKTEAVNAKDQANAAKTQAEGARDKALEAQKASEVARDEAEKILSKTEDIAANNPFEYYTKDGKDKVIKGRDGNLYKESELANYQYDKTQNKYVAKDTSTKEELKSLEAKDVLIKAVPNTIPMKITNVASGLGITTPTDDEKTQLNKLAENVNKKVEALGEKAKTLSDTATKLADLELMVSSLKQTVDTMPDGEAKEKIRENLKKYETQLSDAQEAKKNAKEAVESARNELIEANGDYNAFSEAMAKVEELVEPDSQAELSNVATIGDLQAVAKSGLKFKGNDGVEVRKQLSETLEIKGEGEFNSDRTATGNIKVEMAQDGKGLEVKLSDQLKNMTSFETRTVDGKQSALDSNGLKVSNSKTKERSQLSENRLAFYENDKLGLNLDGKSRALKVGEKAIISINDKNEALVEDLNASSSSNAIANKNYVDTKNNELRTQLNTTDRNLRAGIAGALATSGLPMSSVPGKSMFAASAGSYKGQSAVALGYSRVSDNGKITLRLQGTRSSTGDVGGSVGVGYQW
ncbi:YadA-like family protein [Histophilus somni]|uniref:YadA-like family protein n=1 Tax=Histophilus somni TaxID=731 RepID=UPI00201F0F04|nr:YadA-like family protein [Histophilus somni]